MATLNNIIKLIRGDSYTFSLTIEDEAGDPYVIKPGDAVYFGVMEPNQLFEDAILRKSTMSSCGGIEYDEEGLYTIIINPADTVHLRPGVYYYSVKLEVNHADEFDANERIYKVQTVINNTKFIILD